MSARWWCAATLLFAAMTVALTWPVFRHPASHVLDCESLYGEGAFLIQRDVNLTLWVLAWGAHALATKPAAILHGNAFHPTPWSLALSEHMLGNQPLFAPVYWATGNPVLAYQWTSFATFVLAGLTLAAWVQHHTGDRAAAVVAGVLYAFAPYRLWQLGSLHMISTQWIPLVPLGLDLCFDGRGRLGGLLLAAGLILSTGCSYYTGYAVFLLAAGYGAVLLATRPEARRRLAWPLAAGLAATVVLVVLSVPYLLLQRRGVLPRRTGDEFNGLAFLRLAFDGPFVLLGRFVGARLDGFPLYLGAVTMALALVGVWTWRRAPRAALLAAAAVGAVFAIGPTVLVAGLYLPNPYRVLAAVVPGFAAMRQPQRFGVLTSFAVSALAGLGLARLRGALAARGLRAAAAALPAVAIACAVADVHRTGLRTLAMPVGDTMPAAYRWLAANGAGGAVLELPFADDPVRRLFDESMAMYASTAHWSPLVNGYTPYAPPTYRQVLDAARGLPSSAALEAVFRVVPVRWIVVHGERIAPAERLAWERALVGAGLQRRVEADGLAVWEVAAGPASHG